LNEWLLRYLFPATGVPLKKVASNGLMSFRFFLATEVFAYSNFCQFYGCGSDELHDKHV
jgi:hypothetical protein